MKASQERTARELAQDANFHASQRQNQNPASFHLTQSGFHRAGDVVRVFDGAFGDAVILGFNDQGDAKVSRPYAYVSCAGTTGPNPLLGSEVYTLPGKYLKEPVATGRTT